MSTLRLLSRRCHEMVGQGGRFMGSAPSLRAWSVPAVGRFAAAGLAMAGVAGACCYYGHQRVVARVDSSAPAATKQGDAAQPSHTLPPLPDLERLEGPVFGPETVIVFVLGGPGVGKGTQCGRLVSEYDFVHISAGNLLREERERPGSPYGELIEHYIREGKIVPYEITISLLHKAMCAHVGRRRFLIDGFPRDVEQGIAFESTVCPARLVLFLECDEEEMLKRLLGRSLSSRRTDDNLESIKKRFRVFQQSTLPVRQFYQDLGKLRSISCKGSVDQVFESTKRALHDLGADTNCPQAS